MNAFLDIAIPLAVVGFTCCLGLIMDKLGLLRRG